FPVPRSPFPLLLSLFPPYSQGHDPVRSCPRHARHRARRGAGLHAGAGAGGRLPAAGAAGRTAPGLDHRRRRPCRPEPAIGEPYITHPVAVATALAEQHVDVETLVAAILHDTLEDTPLSRESIAGEFGETVAELVDGVTKLDKLQFADRQEAAAESFRKMMLAMARDLRVIMIKLADRL